ncbi:MAG: PAS domain-containing protein [Chthoniobacterales bacterium]
MENSVAVHGQFVLRGGGGGDGYELSSEVLRAAELARGLRESEQRMTLAAEAARVGIWVRDLERNETWASEQWRALFGFAAAEPVDVEGVLQRLHPDDRARVRQTWAEATEGDGRYEMEFRTLLGDGEIRWVSSRGRAEFDERGRAICIRGVSADITRRKEMEREIQLQRDEVAHLMRVASLGELSSALAHELSQPLTAILSNAQAAQRFLAQDKSDPAEMSEILRDIVADDERATAVIQRLRSLLGREKGSVP